MTNTDRSKLSSRRRYRALRQTLPAQQLRAAATGLAEQVLAWLDHNYDDGPRTVGAYLSVCSEPATDVLLQRLADAGHAVLVPVCEPKFQLAWTRWQPNIALVPSALAPVLEPAGRRETVQVMEDVDVVLVPALAVDAAGNRLGQGGGYYDRFLASLSQVRRTPFIAAVVYEHEFVPVHSFEHSVLDIPVDAVVTPEQWHPVP